MIDELLVLDTEDIFVRVYVMYAGGKRITKRYILDISKRGLFGHTVRITIDDWDGALSDCIDQFYTIF